MAADRFLDTEGLRHLWEKIKAWIPFLSRKTQSIPFGQVDSTSTSTAFTATVDGIDELRDGVCCYLRNGVVTSASGFTININGLGAKPVYNTMASATALTTHFNINYTMLFIYNSTRVSGGCWDMYVGYDTNTTYNLNTNYTTIGHINVGAYPLSYYSLCAFDVNDKLTPFVTTATTSTGKTLVSSVFPIGAKIYSSNYNLSANTSYNDANYLLTTVANQDLRYSSVNHNLAIFPNNTFNRVFMPVIVDVANNTFTLTTQTTNGYTNNFTNERSLKADNFYIEIGFNGKYDYSYYCTLIQNNPLYYYDGTRLIEYSIYKSSIIDVPEYTIEKLASAETGYSSSYVLKKDGTQVGATINIPKDMVVSNGEVKTVTVADEPYQGAQVGDKYIDLTIANTSQNHIYIPVKDLVDVYVAGNGIQISNNNYISVKVNQNQSNGLGVGYDGISMYVVTPSINGVGGTNGSMLATDKEKLDDIEAGADVNVIETVKVSGTALQVADKAVNIVTETAYDPATNKIATMSDVESATPNVGHLKTNNTAAQTPSASESFTSDINLHKVSKTGSYNDLNDQPTIPSDGDFVTSLGTSGNNVTWTKNGVTNNLTVPYATVAGKLGTTTVGGSTTAPIYLSSGVPTAITSVEMKRLGWPQSSYTALDSVGNLYLTAGSNVCANIKPSYVDVEYTNDGGTTWIDYGATDSQKVKLFTTSGDFFVGKKSSSSSTNVTSNDSVRITVHAGAGFYCHSLFMIVRLYCPARCSLKIEYTTYSAQTTWVEHNTYNAQGNPTYLVIPFDKYIFGNNGVHDFRITLTYNGTGYVTLSHSIAQVKIYSNNVYLSNSNLASTNHIYSYDENQNATFPANVTAAKLIKSGGTSSQFLKADGSVDSNTYATTSQLPSLPLSIANGGTGATTAKAAEYNLTPNLGTEITSEFSDTGMIPCLVSPSNTTNGRFYGYRTMVKVWNYIKSKISSVLGIGGSDGVPTAPTAAAGTNTTQIATTAFVQGEIENKADKVSGATNGDIAELDSTGNLTDSGYKPSDFINNFYILNGRSASSGINPWSLCAFAISSSGSVMQMSSFTGTSGSGGGAAVTGMLFPIGCKIYYHPDEQFFTASTDFTSKRFYATYDNVNAKYSSNTGSSLNLGTSSSSTVYLRVIIDGNYWKPYHKNAESYENIVTSNQLIADNFYIYLGKTVGTTGYTIQLEDNNILYYFDGDDLIDWATYIADLDTSSISQDLSWKADKVSNATSGNFAGLDANGNLTDSGHKHSDYLTSHQDISGKEDKTNKVTSLSSSSTDTQYPSAKVVYDQLATKQATLVSGTNIKTVNNTSLLGSGNIQINDGVGFQTITTQQDGTMQITLTNGDIITVDLNHTHPNYYKKTVETTQPQGGFLPDVEYALGPISGNVTFQLASIVVGNVNHYFWSFSTSNSVPTITWPSRIIWQGGTAPTISANRYYEISILNSMAVYLEMELEASV